MKLLLPGHACGCNTSNNYSLEYGVEDKHWRRSKKCGCKGEAGWNVTFL
jgi:hypothetical protein